MDKVGVRSERGVSHSAACSETRCAGLTTRGPSAPEAAAAWDKPRSGGDFVYSPMDRARRCQNPVDFLSSALEARRQFGRALRTRPSFLRRELTRRVSGVAQQLQIHHYGNETNPPRHCDSNVCFWRLLHRVVSRATALDSMAGVFPKPKERAYPSGICLGVGVAGILGTCRPRTLTRRTLRF